MKGNGSAGPAHGKGRRIWGSVAFAGAALVQVTGIGIDLVALAALAGLALLLDRYVADWIGDIAGPGVANLFLAAVLGTGTWFLFVSEEGNGFVQQFMAGAQRRGYEGLLVKSAPGPTASRTAGAPAPPASASGAAAAGRPASDPVATGGVAFGAAPSRAVAGNPAMATRTRLEITIESGGRAVAVASVSTDEGPVRTGFVRFAIDGIVRGRARLDRRGQARWRTPGTAERFAVEAQFPGAGRFLPSVSSAAVVDSGAAGK